MYLDELLAPNETIKHQFTDRLSFADREYTPYVYNDYAYEAYLFFTDIRAIFTLTPRKGKGSPGWRAIPYQNVTVWFKQEDFGPVVHLQERGIDVTSLFVLSPSEKSRSEELQKALLHYFK